MATKEILIKSLTKQINNQHPELSTDKEYILQLDESAEELNLTEILTEAFERSDVTKHVKIDKTNTNVKIILNGNYNIINTNNYFPRRISANIAYISSLTINEEDSVISKNLLELSIFQGCVKKINIKASIKSIIYNSEKDSDLLEIRTNGLNSPNIEFVYIINRIENIFINTAKIEKLYYNNSKYLTHRSKSINININYLDINEAEINTALTRNISIYSGEINNLNINANNDTNEIKIENSICKNTNLLTSGDLNLIKFEHVRNLNSLFIEGKSTSKITNLQLHHLNLSKEFQSQITNHEINRLDFRFVINKGDFIYSFIKINEPIRIISSLIGNCTFVNSTIGPNIIFYSSSIESMIFINSKEPENVLEDKELSNSASSKNIRDGYRQLRIVSEKSGNKHLAIKYRSKELNSELSEYKSNFKQTYKNIDDIIILNLNKISNNHGDIWTRTLKVGIIYGIIIYTLFVLSLHYKFDFSIKGFIYLYDEISIKNILNLLNSYKQIFNFIIPGFLYPTKSKIEDLCSNLGFAYNFNDLRMVSKFLILVNDVIVMPYLIYQGIAAFRKHSGK